MSFGKICLMEVGVVDELDIVELAMIGAAFPCGFAPIPTPAGDTFWGGFWVLLVDRGAAVCCTFGLAGPTSGPDWRAKPPN